MSFAPVNPARDSAYARTPSARGEPSSPTSILFIRSPVPKAAGQDQVRMYDTSRNPRTAIALVREPDEGPLRNNRISPPTRHPNRGFHGRLLVAVFASELKGAIDQFRAERGDEIPPQKRVVIDGHRPAISGDGHAFEDGSHSPAIFDAGTIL
jgi:hypothetical protein